MHSKQPLKNFSLDEMGQVSSWVRPTDDIISPNNSSGIKVPGHDIGIPMKPGEGLKIGPYEERITGTYQPGKQWKLKSN